MKNILLIHGFNGKPLIFDYFKHELSKKGYNVWVPDFPVREDISVKKYFKIFDSVKDIFDDCVVIAHSIGNAMFLKYISKYNIKVKKYISLAGFDRKFYNEGKYVLNEKVKKCQLTDKQILDAKSLISEKFSIFSNNDHIIPLDILEGFSKDINSKAILIKNIGHMGKKSGITELPEVLKLI